MTAKPIVLFVDDDRMALEGFQLAHGQRFDVRVAGGGAAGLGILRAEPDVAVVVSDMAMPHMDGAAFLARARHEAPNAVRLLLTGVSDIESAARAVNAGRIFLFLTKPCLPEEMTEALTAAVETHEAIVSERTPPRNGSNGFAAGFAGPGEDALAKLSDREEEVLRLIAKGLRIGEAARLLKIAPNTVCSHVKSIYRKRHVCSRAEAALEAQRLGLV